MSARPCRRRSSRGEARRELAAAARDAEDLPHERQTVQLAGADLTGGLLVRAGRVNALPLSDFRDEDLGPGSHKRVLAAIDYMPIGTGVIVKVDASGKADVPPMALHALARFRLKHVRTVPAFADFRIMPKSTARP